MKRLLVVVVLVVSLLVLFLQSDSAQSLFTRATATLAIQDTNLPLVLYIDNKLSGTLPLKEQSLTAGVHTFSLRNIKGDDSFDIFWQGELEVNAEDAVVMTLISEHGSQLDGVVLTRFFEQSNEGGYSTVFMEQEGDVYINEQKYENTPAVLSNDGLSDVTIRTEHPIYADVQISFTRTEGTAFVSHVYALYHFLEEIKKEDTVLRPSGTIQNIHRREDWQKNEVPVHADTFSEYEWASIGTFSLVVPEYATTTEMLRMLEQRYRKLDIAERIPYCFVIDPNGEIWEGFGVWDYDFSNMFDDGELQQGQCPVLLLKDNPSRAVDIDVIGRLMQFITQEPTVAMEVTLSQEMIASKSNERMTVDVILKNIGWSTWHTLDADVVRITLANTEVSDVYDQDNWLGPTVVNRVTDPLVIPGGEAIVSLPLQAPLYTIDTREVFKVTFNGEDVKGTGFTITIANEGVGDPVRVVDPPNGFLNVYESDSESTQLLTSLFNNETYPLLQEKGEWVQIRLKDGRDGWVQKEYVQSL